MKGGVGGPERVSLPSSGWGLIDWCGAQILPWVRYIRLQRSKHHYETHSRVQQFREDQNTNGALKRFLLVRYTGVDVGKELRMIIPLSP